MLRCQRLQWCLELLCGRDRLYQVDSAAPPLAAPCGQATLAMTQRNRPSEVHKKLEKAYLSQRLLLHFSWLSQTLLDDDQSTLNGKPMNTLGFIVTGVNVCRSHAGEVGLDRSGKQDRLGT